MAKAGRGTRSRNDGFQFNPFYQSAIDYEFVRSLQLPGLDNESALNLVDELRKFDKWYTAELRELNNPNLKAGKKVLRSIKSSLDKAGQYLTKFDDEGTLFLFEAAHVRGSTREFKLHVGKLKVQIASVTEVLDEAIVRLNSARGAPAKVYRTEAAERLIAIWNAHSLGRFSKTFSTAPGKSGRQEFSSAGPRFVHNVLRYFESAIGPNDVRHALRKGKNEVRVK